MKFVDLISKVQFIGFEPIERLANYDTAIQNELYVMVVDHAANNIINNSVSTKI